MRSLAIGLLASAAAMFLGTQATFAAPSITPIYSFCSVKKCADGGQPFSPIAFDSAGALYGTTFMQAKGGMVVYKLTPGGGGGFQETVLHTFCFSATATCKDGTNPQGRIVVDPTGIVYGATSHGNGDPDTDNGVFYSVTPSGQYTVLYRFCPDGQACATTGTAPVAGLTYFGAESGLPYDGKSPLYGVMLDGSGGSMFRLSLSKGKWTFTKMLSPPAPPSDLITSTDGKSFYMLTVQSGGGGIYLLSPNGADAVTATQLSLFCNNGKCPEGSNATAFSIDPAKGTMYGATNENAAHKFGAVWSATKPNYSPLTDVLDFTGNAAPAFLSMSPIDQTGIAYGVTQLTGNPVNTTTAGTLFQVKNGVFSTVYSFCAKTSCTDGFTPQDGPTPDGHGHFYGVTTYGGAGKYGRAKGSKISMGGVVYEFTP